MNLEELQAWNVGGMNYGTASAIKRSGLARPCKAQATLNSLPWNQDWQRLSQMPCEQATQVAIHSPQCMNVWRDAAGDIHYLPDIVQELLRAKRDLGWNA